MKELIGVSLVIYNKYFSAKHEFLLMTLSAFNVDTDCQRTTQMFRRLKPALQGREREFIEGGFSHQWPVI